MRLFKYLVLSLFFCVSAQAISISPGAVPSLTVGGRTFTDTSNLITLIGRVASTSQNATFRKTNGTAGYTPSTGKTFRALAIELTSDAAAIFEISLLYSTNDVGFVSSTAFTGAIYMSGSTAAWIGPTGASSGATAAYSVDFTVPNGDYLSMTSAGSAQSGTVFVYGYEQ